MLKNLILTFSSRASVAVLNFFVLLVTTRFLGSSVLGQTSVLIVNIAIAQTLNEIYTGYALVHYIPGHSVKKLYGNGLIWTLLCCGLVNLVFLAFSIGPSAFFIHSLILSLVISVHSFHCVILLARERFKDYNFLIFLQPFLMLSTLCFCVFVLNLKTIDCYITALYLSYCGSALLSAGFVLPIFFSEKNSEKVISSVSVLKNGFVNQLGNLAHTLSNRYNFYLIGSSVLVGVYSSATSLIESVWIIGNSISPVLLSYVANKKAGGTNARLTLLLSKISFALSLLCVLVIYFLPPDFFTWLLGKDFSGAKTVMLHLAPGILCISFSTVISHYFSGSGNQRVQLLANTLGLLVTLLSAPFLIARYQLIGACYAASLAYFVQAVVNTVVFMRQNKLSVWELISLKPLRHLEH